MEMEPRLKRAVLKQTLVVMVFITITGSLACTATPPAPTPELNIEATVEALIDNHVAAHGRDRCMESNQ